MIAKKLRHEKIKEIAEVIGKKFNPQKIILFGSYAWGEPGPDSDVDLFIIKETDDTRQTAREMSRTIFPRPFPIDIIVNTPFKTKKREEMGDFFVTDILKKGEVLYGE